MQSSNIGTMKDRDQRRAGNGLRTSVSRSSNPQEGAFACKQKQKRINENNLMHKRE